MTRPIVKWLLTLLAALPAAALAGTGNDPTWWSKYEYLARNGPDPAAGSTTSTTSTGPSSKVDVSNECGPQSETYITLDPNRPKVLAGGSNEIYRLPLRGYFSSDGGSTWGGVDLPLPPPTPGSNDTLFGSDPTLAFDLGIPAETLRGALVYPACDSDRSTGPHRGRLYITWMDLTPSGTTDFFISWSDDRAATWSPSKPVTEPLSILVDRFNHWMSVDAVTGEVNVSSSEHDCNGIFPCLGINYGNQQGDYEGLVASGGIAHPIWTDSRNQLTPSTGCGRPYLMEEVFTAAVR